MPGVEFQTVNPPLCPNSFEIVLKIGTLAMANGRVEVSVKSNPPISDQMDWESYFKSLRERFKVPHPMGTFRITIRDDEVQFDAIECNMPEGGSDPFMRACEPALRGLYTELEQALSMFPGKRLFEQAAERVADVWSMHRATESCGGRFLYAHPELPPGPHPKIPVEAVSVERIMSLGRPGMPPSVSLRDIFSTGLLLIDMEGSGKDRKILVAYCKPGEQVGGWFSQYLAEHAAKVLGECIELKRPTVADEVMMAFPDGGASAAADILEQLFKEEEDKRK